MGSGLEPFVGLQLPADAHMGIRHAPSRPAHAWQWPAPGALHMLSPAPSRLHLGTFVPEMVTSSAQQESLWQPSG